MLYCKCLTFKVQSFLCIDKMCKNRSQMSKENTFSINVTELHCSSLIKWGLKMFFTSQIRVKLQSLKQLLSSGGCSRRYPAYMCVGLPESHTTMVRYSTWKHALLSQLFCVRVPAKNGSNHLILVVSATSDEELVITSSNATAGPLAAQLDYQRPGVFKRTVGVQGLHRATFISEQVTFQSSEHCC